MVVDVGTLLIAGRPMSIDETFEVPAFATFRFSRPAHVVLELQRIDRGIQIDGVIEVEAAGECDRCLEDARVSMQVEVDERFDPPSGTSDPFGENNVLNGTQLDIGDLVRQVVTTSLPFGLVCSEECRGLCVTCGRSKNPGGGCDCPITEGQDSSNDGESEVEDPALEDA